MTQLAKLIHCDLSAYNILIDKGRSYLIDLAQSVDIFHPNNLFFIKWDLQILNSQFKNIETFKINHLVEFMMNR